MTIKNLKDSWQRLKINQVIQESIIATTDNFVELQKAQLYAGFAVTGIKIGDLRPYASPAYAFDKANRNPQPGLGNPDLFDKGDFYDGIDIAVGDNAIKVFSTDSKDGKLEKKYPGALAGVGGPFLEEYINVLQPTIIKRIKNELR